MKKTYYLVVGKTGIAVPGIRVNGKKIYNERMSVFGMYSTYEKAHNFIMGVQNSNINLLSLTEKEYKISPMHVLEVDERDIDWYKKKEEQVPWRRFFVIVKRTGKEVYGAKTSLGTPVYVDNFSIEKIFKSGDSARRFVEENDGKIERVNFHLWEVYLDGHSTFSPYFKFAVKSLREEWKNSPKPFGSWRLMKKDEKGNYLSKENFRTYEEAYAAMSAGFNEEMERTGGSVEDSILTESFARVRYGEGQWFYFRVKEVYTD